MRLPSKFHSCQASTSGRPCEASAAATVAARRFAAAPAKRHCRQRRQRCAAASAADKPDWVRELEETAELGDEAAARLLSGTNSDPDMIQQRMRGEIDSIHARIQGIKFGGEDAPMEVSFRAPIDTFSLWVWVELYRPPTPSDIELLQVLYHQDEDLSEMQYDTEEAGAMPATFHEMAQLDAQQQGPWLRFWADLGTADELSLDILLNMLSTFSREQLGIRQLIVGGQNEDWPVPQRDEFLPDVTMDPMRGPRRFGGQGRLADDDDEDDEEEFLP